MDKAQLVGILAGTLSAVSMLPQLITILKEKKAENVSIWMLLILLSGLALWIVYGVMQEDWPLIITNAFSLLLNLVLVYFRHKYKK